MCTRHDLFDIIPTAEDEEDGDNDDDKDDDDGDGGDNGDDDVDLEEEDDDGFCHILRPAARLPWCRTIRRSLQLTNHSAFFFFSKCCCASRQTIFRTTRAGEPRTATSTFTQLLSSDGLKSSYEQISLSYAFAVYSSSDTC